MSTKLKNILAENMRRFKTKNLLENADRKGNIKIDGESYYVEVYIGAYTKKDAVKLAKKTGLAIPDRQQANQLVRFINSSGGISPGTIWIDQNPNLDQNDLSKEMHYVLYSLDDEGSDVVTLHQTRTGSAVPKPNKDIADAVVLLTPQVQ